MTARRASDFGVVQLKDGNIVSFYEKPKTPALLQPYLFSPALPPTQPGDGAREVWASMGIYAFSSTFLHYLLQRDKGTDFGKVGEISSIGSFTV